LIVVPFDFSRHAIGVQVRVRGAPLYMLLDTGVDPSAIDLNTAGQLGLRVDRRAGSDPSGFGDSKGERVFPSRIDKLSFGGRTFPAFDALASDLSALSTSYGKRIDGIIGYSFLADKIILIDYPDRKVDILADPVQAEAITRLCHLSWSAPLNTIDEFPVIPNFRFGGSVGPVTLDTGSNGGIALFQSVLGLRGVKEALVEKGLVSHHGFKGAATAKAYVFSAAVGFGPFNSPPGQSMIMHDDKGTSSKRVANVGNAFFDALGLKMVLNYRAREMSFFGDCAATHPQ
jgi:hypothetical protein